MKVGVFIPNNNDEHSDMLLAFAKGVHACGYSPELYPVGEYHPVDVAVVFGVGKKNVPVSYARGEVIRKQYERNKPVIVIEKGFVKRDEYYMVGFNGLNNRAEFFNNGKPADRWNNLGVELKPWNYNGKNIVVCGQVPSDASVQNVDIIAWCQQTVNELRHLTGRKIIFRPHPLAVERTPAMLGASLSTKPLVEDLSNAFVVVTYNSNAAVEALINGIPAVAMDRGSMAWDMSGNVLTSLGGDGDPHYPRREDLTQWAYNLAYTQWNKAEMECGLPWLHLTGMRASDAAASGVVGSYKRAAE